MFIKSVELLGFKSFAERTRIDFQSGITTILGPNGCGKSNIVDAIKWVIGEQSSKMLRAENMKEVIFNGTENRKQLNVAEVTLTLYNNNDILPINMPEVSIKRRLYRSGESEYYINSTPVRLKDVKELFFDTGVGKSAYSVMEQGKIDQILSNKPEERRYVFEEAAGITKYKIRSKEAERKLEKTDENLKQVESVLGEVRKNYNTLKKQSEKTREYREIKEKLFELERDIQLLRLKDFFNRRDQKESVLKENSEKKNKVQLQIDDINAAMEKGIDLVNSMESNLIEKQKKLYKLDLEKNNKDSQLKILKERIEELNRKIKDDENRETITKQKLENLKTEIKKTQKDQEEIIKQIKEIESNIAGFKNDIDLFSKKINQNEININKNEAEIENIERSIETLRDELQGVTDDIVTQLDKQLKDFGYSYKERSNIEKEISEILDTLKIQLHGKSDLINDMVSFGNNEKTKNTIHNIKIKLSNSAERLDKLIELFKQYKKSTPSFLDDFLAPDGIITKKREIDNKINEAYENISARKKENESSRNDIKHLNSKINEYRKTLEGLRVNRARIQTKKTSLEETERRINSEIIEQENFLKKNTLEINETREKINDINKTIDANQKDLETLNIEDNKLKKMLSGLEVDISKKNQNLISKEKDLKVNMDRLLKLQAKVEKVHVDLVETKTNIKNVYDNFQEKHSRELTEYESRMFSIKIPISEIKNELGDYKTKLTKLGHLNLMAPEAFEEVKERYEFLSGQIDDLTTAKENLSQITTEIKTESTEIFLETYNKIKKNFNIMFRRLFGGGRATIKLIDPENVLESGIEIFAQPPGKKSENISLLSGGERALTGVSLLFATYLVKPSPFCILDEIDAPLDDSNIGRFIALLKEFSDRSQFLIISHNKRTLSNSNTLLGVTMEETGVSKIVAVKIKSDNIDDKAS